MSNPRTLLTYHDLTVEVETTPNRELAEHMHSTIMGQPGGFRYQHTNLMDRISAPGENYFMYLRKKGKMLGTVGFCGRPSDTDGVSHDCWLIRYASIKAPMRTVPKKRKERGDLKDADKQSNILGRFIQPVFANPSQLREGNQGEDPSLIYGLIEKNNLRSMNFSAQMGMETVGKSAGFTFSRMRPRKSERMERLPSDEREAMLGILKEFYREYTLFFHDPLFKNDDYYVIRESGRIVAGLQIYHVTWRIVDFGSGLANGLVKLLVRGPWMKKRFNAEAFKLLGFDGIYCEQGYESALYELMEGVLEQTETYVVMLITDTKSDLYSLFMKHKKLGILHRILGSFMADIRVRFINLPEAIRDYFLKHPTYLPTYDNT